MQPGNVNEIIEVTLRGGKPVERLCQRLDGQVTAVADTVPFYRGQQRDVLGHCGRLDPQRIDEAIAHGAYAAMAKALTAHASPKR